jgi:coatomer subunit gamma
LFFFLSHAYHTLQQFNVSNTIPDTVLEDVAVLALPAEDSGLTEDFILRVPSVTSTTSPGIVYVSFTRDAPETYATASLSCLLKFVSKELDPSTGEPEQDGYEDEYQLEEIELSAADYIVPSYVSFQAEWDRLRAGASATETFSLSAMESIQGTFPLLLVLRTWGRSTDFFKKNWETAACDSIIEILNLEPLGGSQTPSSTSVHTLQLSGLVTGGAGKVLVRCRMTFARGQGVTLELGVRAEKQEACDLVVAAIGG